MKYFRSVGGILAGLAAMCAPGAFGTSLDPTNISMTVTPSNYSTCGAACGDATAFTGVTLLADSNGFISKGGTLGNNNIAGFYTVGVATDKTNGTLDFLYQFDPAVTDLSSATMQNFFASTAGNPIGVGYLTDVSLFLGVPGFDSFRNPTTTGCGTSAGCAPTTAGPSFGTITFSGFVKATTAAPSGGTVNGGCTISGAGCTSTSTDILVIRTSATTYENPPLNSSAQDGGTVNFMGYDPTPEPGFAGLLLSGLFGVGLIVARRFRVVQN